jgi:hypothetical protein
MPVADPLRRDRPGAEAVGVQEPGDRLRVYQVLRSLARSREARRAIA